MILHGPEKTRSVEGELHPLYFSAIKLSVAIRKNLKNLTSTLAYPRDPPKNDLAVYKSAATESLGRQRYHVMNHHRNAFETSGAARDEANDDSSKVDHRKTQHFIQGQVLV